MFNIRNYCINCGIEIDYRANRCRKCSAKNEERSQRISEALKGKQVSIETKKKISESHKKNIKHLEFMLKLNKAKKGKSLSEEHRRKLSEAHKGKKLTNKHKIKLIETLKEWHKNNPHPCLGRKFSEEHKRKIGEKSKGRKFLPRSKESRKKTSDALKNPSKETRERFAKSKRGDKNPNWQGGISFEPYSPGFNEKLKQTIRGRDNYTCQMPECGIRENGRKHSVHHIDYNKNNNNAKNLITICVTHHAITNNKNRKYWTELFQEQQLENKHG